MGGLSVCSLLPPVNEISVSYVATHEIDERPVYDHKTGERLARHLVKIGRRTECEAMVRHQLFERVLIPLARDKKERCHWLDEMKQGPDGPFVRGRLVAMEVARGIRFDTFAGTAPLKCIKIIISRAASIKNERGQHTRVLALHDISVAFWHAQLHPRRANREVPATWRSGSWIHVANEAAMYGTRRASRLSQEHMKWVLGEAGDAALKVCHQVYYCLDADSMAAIHGDDIIAEGEPEELNRLVEVLKRLVVVKVLDRIGPGAEEHGQYLMRHIVYIEGQCFEWLEDRKHLAAIIRNRSKIGAKPQSSPGSKDLSDPEALDELAEVEAKLYQQETGISIPRVQRAIRHTVLREETEGDDVETTEDGQPPTGQAVEISRGHAEAYAQI